MVLFKVYDKCLKRNLIMCLLFPGACNNFASSFAKKPDISLDRLSLARCQTFPHRKKQIQAE